MFDYSAVLKAVRSFPKGTAEGASGFRAQHLVDAYADPSKQDRESVLVPMAEVCTLLAAGKAPANAAPWIASAPIFPLKKKQGGIRPIAVGEVFRRLVSKLVLISEGMQERIDKCLREVGQYGVRVKGGADAIIQAIRMWMADPTKKGQVAIKFDFENAFNSIDRNAVRGELEEGFPGLLHWYDFCYAAPANLFCQNKLLPFGSVQGVQQGDPLGPLLFALGIRKVCKCIKETWQKEQDRFKERTGGSAPDDNPPGPPPLLLQT